MRLMSKDALAIIRSISALDLSFDSFSSINLNTRLFPFTMPFLCEDGAGRSFTLGVLPTKVGDEERLTRLGICVELLMGSVFSDPAFFKLRNHYLCTSGF